MVMRMLRRLFGSLLVLCLVAGAGFFYIPEAVSLEPGAFEKANNAYEAADYSEAIQIYESLADQGLYSGELFYNMGNTYFRMNSPGDALLSYRRAAFFMPRDPDLRANIDFIAGLVDIPPDQSAFYPISVIGKVAQNFTFSELSFFAAGLFLVLIIILFIVPVFRRQGLFVRFVALFLTMIFTGTVYVVFCKYRIYSQMTVMQDGPVQVRYAPVTASTVFFVIPEGAAASALKEENGWIRIREGQGKTGWTERENAAFLKLDKAGR